jgi:hypothetical protein
LGIFCRGEQVGWRMRLCNVSHVQAACFSAGIVLIIAQLLDPEGTHLTERIKNALFVAQSAATGVANWFGRSERSNLVCVPLGIDAAEFPSQTKQLVSAPPWLLGAGRLTSGKAQALLLEAIAALQAKGCTVQLSMGKDEPDRPWWEKRAAEQGMASNAESVCWVDRA